MKDILIYIGVGIVASVFLVLSLFNIIKQMPPIKVEIVNTDSYGDNFYYANGEIVK